MVGLITAESRVDMGEPGFQNLREKRYVTAGLVQRIKFVQRGEQGRKGPRRAPHAAVCHNSIFYYYGNSRIWALASYYGESRDQRRPLTALLSVYRPSAKGLHRSGGLDTNDTFGLLTLTLNSSLNGVPPSLHVRGALLLRVTRVHPQSSSFQRRRNPCNRPLHGTGRTTLSSLLRLIGSNSTVRIQRVRPPGSHLCSWWVLGVLAAPAAQLSES